MLAHSLSYTIRPSGLQVVAYTLLSNGWKVMEADGSKNRIKEEAVMKITSADGSSGRPECLCWDEAAH